MKGEVFSLNLAIKYVRSS